ncbi:hypothetical protein HPP92_026879 [Vanilla planifolia]|uniref:LYR motif-containing protein 2 n=1 Tax=Vanilla planifolia TaxID=51239 RepID=A0A835PE68_VANPL|nr:hypothetical protein HPP92_026879 [Vanilla planifolia]
MTMGAKPKVDEAYGMKKLKMPLKEMAQAMDLRAFITRARVLKLYRHALRTAYRAPPHSRGELLLTMRLEMENNRHCDDPQRIQFFISEGLQRLKALDEMLDMQGHH